MKISDLAAGLVLLLFAAVIFAYARTFSVIPGQPYGAGAFPTVVALGLGLFSAILAWRGLQARRSAGPAEKLVGLADWARDGRTLVNFLLLLVLVLVYVFASETVGFIPLSIAILVVLFWRMGVRPLTAVGVAIATSIVIDVAFANLLRVPLPRGILDSVLW
jgi:putative tricarboxylic transport membrane protein